MYIESRRVDFIDLDERVGECSEILFSKIIAVLSWNSWRPRTRCKDLRSSIISRIPSTSSAGRCLRVERQATNGRGGLNKISLEQSRQGVY